MPYLSPQTENNNPSIEKKPWNTGHTTLARSAILNATTSTSSTTPLHPLAVDMPDIASTRQHLRHSSSSSITRVRDVNGPPVNTHASSETNASLVAPNYRQALNDTPLSTAPSSPHLPPRRQNSGDKVRIRPTTLDIPGLTKSSASPDGRIASIDVGSKLVIVMVGLPARGKSYITKKLTRYLNWLQHDTRIFNVGERRRVHGARNSISDGKEVEPVNGDVAAGSENQPPSESVNRVEEAAARILGAQPPIPELRLPEPEQPDDRPMEHSASFFDPDNREASRIREQCAIDTLDELLSYILHGGGSVGILDATNSTLERRRLIVEHVRQRAGPNLGILFLESQCIDEELLDRNMRLKLSGPDYRDKDPHKSLEDFKKRVQMYAKSYVPLGDYEERHNISFVQMIDVGRKIISHQIKGFLSTQAVSYLLNFNLAPRMIWITRHGESEDNASGRIGGNSPLTARGRNYAKALSAFCQQERKEWEVHEIDKKRQAHLSPLPGITTPPNPHYEREGDDDQLIQKNFCVWTSMLRRSIETGQYFSEDEFDVKQMKMLDEISAGQLEGLTYEQIKSQHKHEYEQRRHNKLHYRYPGPGGESYLDVINRLRPVIVELERTTDHVLLIGHRSIARVLLAYFLGLGRDEVAGLDVPIGMAYCLEPKPYGVSFKAFRYDEDQDAFISEPDYKLRSARAYSI